MTKRISAGLEILLKTRVQARSLHTNVRFLRTRSAQPWLRLLCYYCLSHFLYHHFISLKVVEQLFEQHYQLSPKKFCAGHRLLFSQMVQAHPQGIHYLLSFSPKLLLSLLGQSKFEGTKLKCCTVVLNPAKLYVRFPQNLNFKDAFILFGIRWKIERMGISRNYALAISRKQYECRFT